MRRRVQREPGGGVAGGRCYQHPQEVDEQQPLVGCGVSGQERRIIIKQLKEDCLLYGFILEHHWIKSVEVQLQITDLLIESIG